MTLPTAVGIAGRQYSIKKIDSSANVVNIATSLSQTIDGLTTAALSTQYQYLTVISDGANWSVVGAAPAPTTGSGTPNAFSFTDLTSQPWGSLVASNTIAVTGFVGTMVASVTGGGAPEISINNGAWTTSGAIQSGQSLRVRLTTSNAPNTTATATVSVGSVTSAWQVTTRSGSLLIFKTRNGYVGSSIGGVAGADAICQSEASSAGYSGSYKAIVSTSTQSAASRLTLSYPIVNANDSSTVASANLWSGTLSNLIKDSTGAGGLCTFGRTWTGTLVDGSADSATCSDWSANTNGAIGGSFTDARWAKEGTDSCLNTYCLFCVQQ